LCESTGGSVGTTPVIFNNQLLFMNQIISDGQQGVEVTIPGVAGGQSGTDFAFPDLPYLRPDRAKIKAIEVFTLASISNGPVSGNVLPSLAKMQAMSLTLYGGVLVPTPDGMRMSPGTELIRQIPLLRFNQMQNATPDPFNRNIVMLKDMLVDWTKSKVSIKGTTPANTVNWAVVFNVYYDIINSLN
jgi:hypothetical protein